MGEITMGKRTLSVKNLMKLLWKMEDALFISVPAGRMQRKFQKNW
ncbi:hypothetical protein RUMGNA_03881 [Mediterraneibacter gnavus ATCC 29149]|jgi:hypothetical protein|uniref:Uncharacterized protein n=1 Tax=Mediterraneibacter gnavus (strain ATCC 29149 / DSM 114966 / JCM 6515 / VPI C7-9) TaxID=411470 RepID=A7B8F9_MEDG7|nr:hypothetical protein RUMGNA_03881 [Mediterraneibacter gnavus ATCC 29149]